MSAGIETPPSQVTQETTAAEARQPGALSGGMRVMAAAFRGRTVPKIAAAVLLIVVVVAIFAPLIAPFSPTAQDLAQAFQGPSWHHLLGTDNLGRDTLSRIIFGARVALPASALGVGIAAGVGIPIGLAVGYAGGLWDQLSMRVIDALLALPAIVVAIAVLAALGPGLYHAMIALGFLIAPGFARLARGLTLAAREELYVDAARVVGESRLRILSRELLPNVAGPLVVQATITFGHMLLAEAGLSFLGLGAQPPQASWGSMLTIAKNQVYNDAFLAIPPGVALLLTVLSINIVGDTLRSGLVLARRGEAAPGPVARRMRVTGPALVPPEAVAAVEEPIRDIPDTISGVALSVQGLTVSVATENGPLTLVDHVSFEVGRGETLGIVGESGCGKSMSALALAGLLPPGVSVTGGQVHLGGLDLLHMSDKEADSVRGNRIGMIFQDPSASLDPAFKVVDQVAEPLRVHQGLSRRDAYRRAIELLDQVRLPQAARRAYDYPHQLSGGQAQRVMIAAALACQPDVLIADEPTTALDVTVQGRILDLLAELQRDSGTAIVLITHDLAVIADSCQRVAVMYAGQVVETAAADRLFAQPTHPYTEGLLATLPDAERPTPRLAQIDGQVPQPEAWPAHACRFASRCPYVKPVCVAAMPALRPVSEGSASRCVRFEELSLVGARP